ncbi:7803_t:CDS:2, partial [Scutellospora calospora]
ERAYYGNPIGQEPYTFMGDIVGSHWVSSNVEGNEDQLVGDRQNPIHDFDVILDLFFFGETIMIHRIKDIKMLNAIKNIYSKYEEGLPMIRVIWNSRAAGLVTKRELVPSCWTVPEIWNQTLQCTYKNWFYEAWGLKERKNYVLADTIGII